MRRWPAPEAQRLVRRGRRRGPRPTAHGPASTCGAGVRPWPGSARRRRPPEPSPHTRCPSGAHAQLGRTTLNPGCSGEKRRVSWTRARLVYNVICDPPLHRNSSRPAEHRSRYSSVGRAFDCSGYAEIELSLVRFRVARWACGPDSFCYFRGFFAFSAFGIFTTQEKVEAIFPILAIFTTDVRVGFVAEVRELVADGGRST